MNSSDTRISSYLDTLSRLTADLDPATRDDVIAGVREHLDATLAEHPDDPHAVDAALLRLGPPEQVAAAARADAPPRPPAAAWPASPMPPRTPTPWLARGGAVGVALCVLVPTVAMAVDRLQLLVDREDSSTIAGLSFFLLLFMSTPWLAALVCVLLSRGLTPTTRLRLTLLGPLAGIAVLAGTFALSPPVPTGVASLVGAAVVVIATLVLTVRAWREVGR